MKAIWIALMLGCMAGFVSVLITRLDKYDEYGIVSVVIGLWVLCLVFIIGFIFTFNRASKLGKLDDLTRENAKIITGLKSPNFYQRIIARLKKK